MTTRPNVGRAERSGAAPPGRRHGKPCASSCGTWRRCPGPTGSLFRCLTYGAGAHPGMDGSFVILRFPEPADPDISYVQYRRGSVYLEEPADVGAYAEVFDHLRARALGPDESRALIARLADQMT